MFSFAAILAPVALIHAAELHVAITGSDASPGTQAAPLRTIQRAAERAMPGDTVTVHAGLYREHVNPPRGGISDSKRIIYQAAPGEEVIITGSEPAKGWVKESGDTWKLTLPNSYFGKFNPFAKAVHGDWFDPRGRVHHLGMVYLNGEWMAEAASHLNEVRQPAVGQPRWYARVDGAGVSTSDNTTIWAQFPGIDPNTSDVEIAKRHTVFTPEKTNIDYITVRGFKLRNAASNWAAPTSGQHGLVTAYWCKGWIIEDNEISYSRCCGIALGKYSDEWDNRRGSQKGYHATIADALKTGGWYKDKIGGHSVRRNHIHDGRETPYHKAHSTEVAGRRDCPLGDVRWYNNILAGKCNLTAFDKAVLPVAAAGNVFTKGAQSSKFDEAALLKPDFEPGITLTQQADGWHLELNVDKAWAAEQKRRVVGTEMLGKAIIPDLPFENADGSPLKIDTDYFGKKRDMTNPFPGPFEVKESGKQKMKVWPLASTRETK